MAVVIVITKVTARPNPLEEVKSFETDIKEHIPKKLERSMLLVKIEAKNKDIKPTSGDIIF
jgi:hypothetical protein